LPARAVVIMDNASFHKRNGMVEAIEQKRKYTKKIA
jgi:hypothetical protein